MKPRKQRLKVLFVDDDPSVLTTWRYAHGEAFDASFVRSGKEALDALSEAAAAQVPYDVMVIDQRMPGMLGSEVCWRACEASPTTGRLVVTAYQDPVLRNEFFHVLEKPVRNERLQEAIRRAATHRCCSDEELHARLERAERAEADARRELHAATQALLGWARS